jgi:hypothetical protein
MDLLSPIHALTANDGIGSHTPQLPGDPQTQYYLPGLRVCTKLPLLKYAPKNPLLLQHNFKKTTKVVMKLHLGTFHCE